MSHNSSRQLWDSCTAAQGMQATLLHSRLLGSGFFCVCFFVVCLFPPPTAGNPVSDLQVKLTLVLRYPLFAGSWADPSGRARAGGPGQGAGAGAALRGSCRLGARSLGCRAQPSPEPALTLWGVRAPRGCWEHNGERLCLHGSSCRAGNWLYHSFQIFTLYRSPNILKLDSQRCLQIACQHRASRIRQRAGSASSAAYCHRRGRCAQGWGTGWCFGGQWGGALFLQQMEVSGKLGVGWQVFSVHPFSMLGGWTVVLPDCLCLCWGLWVVIQWGRELEEQRGAPLAPCEAVVLALCCKGMQDEQSCNKCV